MSRIHDDAKDAIRSLEAVAEEGNKLMAKYVGRKCIVTDKSHVKDWWGREVEILSISVGLHGVVAQVATRHKRTGALLRYRDYINVDSLRDPTPILRVVA